MKPKKLSQKQVAQIIEEMVFCKKDKIEIDFNEKEFLLLTAFILELSKYKVPNISFWDTAIWFDPSDENDNRNIEVFVEDNMKLTVLWIGRKTRVGEFILDINNKKQFKNFVKWVLASGNPTWEEFNNSLK